MKTKDQTVESFAEVPGIRPSRASGTGLVSGYHRRSFGNSFVLAGSDTIAILLSFMLAGALRTAYAGSPSFTFVCFAVVAFWLIAAGFYNLLPGWGMSPVESLQRMVTLTCVVFGGTVAVLFLTQSGADHSRIVVTGAFLISMPLIPFMRMQVKGMMVRHGSWGIPVAVYGQGDLGRAVIDRLREEPGQGYFPEAVLEKDPDPGTEHLGGVPVWDIDDPKAPRLPVAIVTMPWFGKYKITSWLEGSLSRYRRVVIVPDLVDGPSVWVNCRDLNGIPGLEIAHNLLDPSRRVLKRSIDLAATVLTAPFWGTLCGLVAFLIWLEDRHHPFFIQTRIGEDGKKFRVWKFRTMIPDAEAILRQRLETDEAFRNAWEGHYKMEDDPRITRVGNLLRKFSIDEIPQLINVLRGEMSLVGPRPLPAYHYDQLPEEVRNLRERVRPGMTGMWQVSGRSDSGNTGMVRWDPYYVRNWSVWLDIIILIRTIRVVIKGSGAY